MSRIATPLDRAAGLNAFVRAAEAGSFSAAARLAGASPSSVSKSVERLERHLGVRLFRRSTRALSLTPEGIAYYDRVAPLLRALENADDALGNRQRAEGPLRASIPGILGPGLVDAITARFLPAHPGIRLDLNIADSPVDIVRDGFDLALRVGWAGNTEWIVRTLGTLDLHLVASPGYLARAGTPRTRADLLHHAHVRYRTATGAYPIRFADGTQLLPEGAFDSDSGTAMRMAAINGTGIAQLLAPAVEADVAAGRLVRVLPDLALASPPVVALHAFGRVPPLRVRLFADFVAETLFARPGPTG